jgi:ACT domain-containing protein
MNAIITVVGKDKVGIIAKVSSYLSGRNINILDINQTILSGAFVMIMKVAVAEDSGTVASLKKDLDKLGTDMGVSISLMHEAVFEAMHRL